MNDSFQKQLELSQEVNLLANRQTERKRERGKERKREREKEGKREREKGRRT